MSSKKTTLPLDKAIRASVSYHVNENGSISQVINHILPTGEKRQIPIHATSHAKVFVTEHGLQAQFNFPRTNMTIEEIVETMYSESDDIMSWLQTESATAIEEADKTFSEQRTKKVDGAVKFAAES